jgi:hypothetical protein
MVISIVYKDNMLRFTDGKPRISLILVLISGAFSLNMYLVTHLSATSWTYFILLGH